MTARQAAGRLLLTASAGVLVVVSTLVAPSVARADETTISYSPSRTSWDADEPQLTPSQVGASDFGQQFSTQLPAVSGKTQNQIYAQPISASGTLIVATEENQVDGLDPASGALRWTVSLGPSWPASTVSCGDLAPDVGVTSTPVYDPTTNAVYVVAKTNDGPDVQHPIFRMHALDPDTGVERSGWPVVIAGSPSNGGPALVPRTANQRAGLLLLDGRVYMAFASHCDQGPYVGYVGGVDLTSRSVSLWAAESGNATDEGGIWQSGGGLVSDGAGTILVATGNGVSPSAGPGNAPPGTLAESVVRLAVSASGVMTATDFFSPSDNAKLDQDDADLGSGGPVALPDSFGTSTHPHLLVIAGKGQEMYLLDRDQLGGMGQGPGQTNDDLSEYTLPNGVWGHASAFSSSDGTNYLYTVPRGSPMQVMTVAPDGGGNPTLSRVATTAETFGYLSGSPVVTSTGSDPSSALVWVMRSANQDGSGATLLAYDAVPTDGTMHVRYQTSIGTIDKFVQPATDGGHVYVATKDGRVLGFGHPATTAITASPVDFGYQDVSTTSGRHSLLLTANQAVTVQNVSVPAPFALGSVPLPKSLSSGQTLSVPATFSPTTTGGVSAPVTITTDVGTFTVDLHGVGTQAGLGAAPTSLDFGDVPTGTTQRLGVSVQNTSQSAETITGSSGPGSGSPFTVSGVPASGTTLQPQQSVTLAVSFLDQNAGEVDTTLGVTSNAGSVSIPVRANSVSGSAHLTISPAALDFGQVSPGQRRNRTFSLTNDGTVALTITKAAPPASPFSVAEPVGEGQQLQPGDSITQTVTVRPTSAQHAAGVFLITGDDGQGAQQVNLTVNAAQPAGPITSALGCMNIAGAATADGTAANSRSCNGTSAQLFTQPGDGTLRVLGKCLGAARSSSTVGTPIALYTCTGAAGQKWTWRTNQSLYNMASALCLAVQGNSAAASTPLVLATCAKSTGQLWNLSLVQRNRGQVSNPDGFCLDVRGAKTTDGTTVQQATCTLKVDELVSAPASGTVQVLNKCLDVLHQATTPGAAVVILTCSGAASQRWKQGSNTTLVSTWTGLCLAAPSSTAGLALVLANCANTPAQRWPLPTS